MLHRALTQEPILYINKIYANVTVRKTGGAPATLN